MLTKSAALWLVTLAIQICFESIAGLRIERSLIHGPRKVKGHGSGNSLETDEEGSSGEGSGGEGSSDEGSSEETTEVDGRPPSKEDEGEPITKPDNYEEIVRSELENYHIIEADVVNEVIFNPSDDFESRAGTTDPSLRWNYRMLIEIDHNFSPNKQSIIRSAIYTLKKTMQCFDFRIVRQLSRREDGLFIKNGNEGCGSNLGRTGGIQETVLSNDCVKLYGIAMHEILHVLGFYHEQVRPDRNKYVRIHNEVLPTEEAKHQYAIRPNQRQFVNKYDFGSIMHYPFDRAMSPKRKIPKGVTVGQRAKLSKSDEERIKKMYPCNGRPSRPRG